MTARDRDKVIALLKSVAAECEGDQDDHKWRTCRHCLAVEELDRRDIRRLVGEFAATHQQGGHQP